MIGTKKPVNRPIDLMPPRITAPAATAMTRPLTQCLMPKEPFKASATELDCTMLPMPNAATAANRANSHPRILPSGCQRIPRAR